MASGVARGEIQKGHARVGRLAFGLSNARGTMQCCQQLLLVVSMNALLFSRSLQSLMTGKAACTLDVICEQEVIGSNRAKIWIPLDMSVHWSLFVLLPFHGEASNDLKASLKGACRRVTLGKAVWNHETREERHKWPMPC